jgi:hypothetical protein
MSIPSEVIDLLICCAGVDPEKGPKLVAMISTGIEWNLVLEQGHRHEILPLLYWSLKTHCPDKVPDPIMKELGEFFQANARKNLFAISELLRILNLLEDQGVKAIPFKGPVLASLLYGNPALRCYGDLDIMISKADLVRIKKILLSIGYLPNQTTNSISEEKIFIQSSYEYGFHRKGDGSQIDVHWGFYLKRFFDPMSGDLRLIKAENISFGGKTVSTLSKEDLLTVLSIHGAVHGWRNLKLISDLAKLLEICQIDWPQVFHQAALLKCQHMIYTALLLAHKIMEAPVPDYVLLKARQDNSSIMLTRKVCDRLYSGGRLGIWSARSFFILSNDRQVDGLLYYLNRPTRLFKTYALRILKGLPFP